jgi:hypothetical protein
MNIYPDLTIGGPPAPEDWTMSVDLDGFGESAAYFADLHRAGQPVCRLVVAGVKSEDEARRILAVKARLWINEYLSRPQSGATAFGTLGHELPSGENDPL